MNNKSTCYGSDFHADLLHLGLGRFHRYVCDILITFLGLVSS